MSLIQYLPKTIPNPMQNFRRMATNASLTKTQEHDEESSLALDFTKQNNLKKEIQHLINDMDKEIECLLYPTSTSQTKNNLISHFSTQSSQLLENLNNTTNPLFTTEFKDKIEKWIEYGNTITNTPSYSQTNKTLENTKDFLLQGKYISEIIHSQIPQLNSASTEYSLQSPSDSWQTHSLYQSDDTTNYLQTSSTPYVISGSDLNMFTILINVLTCMNQISINTVEVQMGVNTNYSNFLGNMQDLQSILTQISSAFKSAAANAALINPSNSNMNIGFDGSATVASNTSSAKYDGITESMEGKNPAVNGQNQTWNIAQLLTMYSIQGDTGTPINYSSKLGVFQNAAWSKQIFTTNYGNDPLKDIYIGVGSASVSPFIKQYCHKVSSISSINYVKDASGQAIIPDSDSYFVNQDDVNNMIKALGAQAKAFLGSDFSDANQKWASGATQCDGLLNSLSSVTSSVQSQSNGVVQQIGLVNQNSTTMNNNILSSFQSLTNALIKI